MKLPEKQKAVGFSKSAIASPVPTNTAEKIDFIRKGKKKKTITGFKEKKDVTIENKGGKFVVVEKEKTYEEAGVTKKKRNFIKFESKLGTEKETDLTKIAGAKRERAIEPRQEERIIQKRKKKEYLDNYQYHETKVIRNPKPNRISVVEHKRLGDIIGGFYEEALYERQVLTTTGNSSRPTSVLKERKKKVSRNSKPTSPSSNQRNKPNTSTITQTSRRQLKPYSSVTNLRTSPLAKVTSTSKAPNTRRLSREEEMPINGETEVTKTETKIVTKEGRSTKTTTTNTTTKKSGRRTSGGGILKNKKQ